MKSKTVQRMILKIESSEIRNFSAIKLRELNKKEKTENTPLTLEKDFKWEYEIDMEKAMSTDKTIMLGESHTLRTIDKILGKNEDIKEAYDEYMGNIKLLKSKRPLPEDNKNKDRDISFFYKQIQKLQFQENYIMIVFNRKSDYDKVNKGFTLNGKSFKRLYATTGSIKKNTVIYICDDVLSGRKSQTLHGELLKRLMNDKKDINIVPSKYEAYLSLNSSASTPIGVQLKAENILVVPDHVVSFKTPATLIHESKGGYPNIEYVDDYEFTLEQSDGCGIITPELSLEIARSLGEEYIPTGFIIRNSFIKGSLLTFDLQSFKEEIGKLDLVDDIWNKDKRDISKVKIVMPASMFKLWEAYDSIDQYWNMCGKNGHEFAITKMLPQELESERTMNYQFLAPLNLKKEDVMKLINPTIKEFHDILGGDLRKAILFLRGVDSDEIKVTQQDADFLKALLIDETTINDMHIRKKIMDMMQGLIIRGKIGQVKVKGNYSLISGCIYGFAQHIFKMDNTDGLLKEGEFYSNYWNERGVTEVAAMRAPMCTHSNYRILKLKDNAELRKWYKYMTACIVFNSHDSTVESLSGADKDK